MDALENTGGNDFGNDASLLEGLFQLAVAGDTDGWEFKKIDNEVYSRLLDSYAA